MDPGTCDKCGCRVPKPTPEHAAWIAKEHRQYCPGCLQDRKAAIEVVKRLKARKRRAAHAAASPNAWLMPPPGHLLVEKLCEALFGGKIEELGEGKKSAWPEPGTGHAPPCQTMNSILAGEPHYQRSYPRYRLWSWRS
jgi:hypothetical protein